LPSAFLAVDELLLTANLIVADLRLYTGAITRNLQSYGVFAATERVLMALVRQGADRQEMHEIIREHAMTAWAAVHGDNSQHNPLPDLLSKEACILRFISPEEVLKLLDATTHIGDAPHRARAMADQVRTVIKQ
jgi:adenylosuccinate lyase